MITTSEPSIIYTSAEKRSLQIEHLTNFQDFNLVSFKKLISEVLSFIGRNGNGIFLTYSKHDISHINALLNMAEWVIPESTQKNMTSVDWLMITLACYLHDLGMFTTDEEYEKRNNDAQFLDFQKWIQSDVNAEDYRARVALAPDADRFMFQEFIRSTHAQRIKQWISGKFLNDLPQTLNSVAKSISMALSILPPRFVNDLALVCESHHLNDLHKENKYPLYQTYGSSTQESANVQYAAVILRTLDLLHITRDRTPSIVYRSLNVTDPLGIQEWEKQMGTYSVLPASRVITDDPETHIISVSADFTDERAFFSLSEYLSYADSQIKQSKTWISESLNKPNGVNYDFPWIGVKGSIKVEGNDPIPLKFELDRGKLLDLLVGHTIYNEPTVVIRELLQNSIDATRFKAYKNKTIAYNGEITVRWNSKTKELSIIDNGTGMDKNVITNYLMKVGSSFYNTTEFKNENSGFSSISKFGIGVLTCFMVSDDIEIITKKGKKGFRIRMTSVHSNYLLKELDEKDPILKEVSLGGTIVNLKFRSSVDLKKSIKDILKYWIIFPESKVTYVDENQKPEGIGFKDVEEAFNHYYANLLISQNSDNFKVIVDNKNVSDENYQIAYAVTKNFLDIPSFLYGQKTDAPKICLEGIRVSDSFNREGYTRSLAAIVSIRNNPKIRTTVSRDGFEKDTEYYKILEHCTSLFLQRIKSEVNSITQLPETPLSRAAVTAEWMLDGLVQTFGHTSSISNFHYLLPTLVVEDTVNGKVSKQIISKKSLEAYNYFYTVESRVLNYLSILSKDLGRELGYYTFITKMAPELMEDANLPLLISSTKYDKEFITVNFNPETINVSKKYQRVSVKWIYSENSCDWIEKAATFINNQDVMAGGHQVLFGTNASSYKNTFKEKARYIRTCFIQSEEQEYMATISNEYVLLSPESSVKILWEALKTALGHAQSQSNAQDVIELAGYICLFYEKCIRHEGPGVYSSKDIQLLWNGSETALTNILNKYDINLSGYPSSYFDQKEKWFILRKYWHSW